MAFLSATGISTLIHNKAIERIISPMAAQLCHLIILSEWGNADNGRFANLESTAGELTRATEQLSYVAHGLGTWNIRIMSPGLTKDLQNISDAQKTAVINNKLSRLQMDIVALQETRLSSIGCLGEKDFTFSWHRKLLEETREHGTGFTSRNNLVGSVIPPNMGNERLLKIQLQTPVGMVNIFSVYVPALTSTQEVKDKFCDEFSVAITEVPSHEPLFILGNNKGCPPPVRKKRTERKQKEGGSSDHRNPSEGEQQRGSMCSGSTVGLSRVSRRTHQEHHLPSDRGLDTYRNIDFETWLEKSFLENYVEAERRLPTNTGFKDKCKLFQVQLNGYKNLSLGNFYLTKCIEQKIVPKGLRLNKFPNNTANDMEFFKIVSNILNECGLAILKVMIENNGKKMEVCKREIDILKSEIMNDLLFTVTEYKNIFCKTLQEVDNIISKNYKRKMEKLERDIGDYEKGKAYFIHNSKRYNTIGKQYYQMDNRKNETNSYNRVEQKNDQEMNYQIDVTEIDGIVELEDPLEVRQEEMFKERGYPNNMVENTKKEIIKKRNSRYKPLLVNEQYDKGVFNNATSMDTSMNNEYDTNKDNNMEISGFCDDEETSIKIRYRTDGRLFNLQMLLAKTKVEEKNFGLIISTKKTEVLHQPAAQKMYVEPTIIAEGEILKAVDKFTYLGSTLSRFVNIDDETDTCIAKASSAFGWLQESVWERRSIKLSTRLKVYKAVVLPTILYACETWTVYYCHAKKLNHFHMNCLRRLLKITWQDKVPGTVVLSVWTAKYLDTAEKSPSQVGRPPYTYASHKPPQETVLWLSEAADDKLLQMEMESAADFLNVAGKTILLAAQKLHIQPEIQEHRQELSTAAQNILIGTMKILLTEDAAEVRKIMQAADWLLDCLILLESARDMPALLSAFCAFSEALLLLNNLVERRIQVLKESVYQQHLDKSLQTLKKCIPMLCTALHTSLKYPQNERVNVSKKYILDRIDEVITELLTVLKQETQDDEYQGQGGLLPQQLHRLLHLLSSSKHSTLAASDFSTCVESIVVYCMLLADASRPNLQLKMIKHCQYFLQLRTEILEHRKTAAALPTSNQLQCSFEHKCETMMKEVDYLDHLIAIALLYQIMNTFSETKQPLERLLKVAQDIIQPGSKQHHQTFLNSLQPLIASFHAHADEMLKVASFVSAFCSSLETFKGIQDSAECLHKLRTKVAPFLYELSRDSRNEVVLKKLKFLYQKWVKESEALVACFDDIISVDEFLVISVQGIREDTAKCEDALKIQHCSQFEQHATALLGKAHRVAQIVGRHLNKSKDPIFRNGLLVLIKHLETCLSQVQASVKDCIENRLDDKSVINFFKTVQYMTDSVHTVSKGMVGLNHPDILSPLREQVRKGNNPVATNYISEQNVLFSVGEKQSKECNENTGSLEKYVSIPLPELNSNCPTASTTNKACSVVPASNILHVLDDIIVSSRNQDITMVNTACTTLLELTNCYVEAAKEAIVITDETDSQTLVQIRAEVISLTPQFISLAGETAINPISCNNRLFEMAMLLSDSVDEIKSILRSLMKSTLKTFQKLNNNLSAANNPEVMQTVTKVMASLSEIVQLASNATDTHSASSFVYLGAQETLMKVKSRFKKAQNSSKQFIERLEVIHNNELHSTAKAERLEGHYILWSVFILTLLQSIDNFIGRNIIALVKLTTGTKVKSALQKELLHISENSARIQEAARLSSSCCADYIKNKIVTLNKEVMVLTENVLQAVEFENRLHSCRASEFQLEILQRKLAIQIKSLLLLLEKTNKEYTGPVKSLINLSLSATEKCGDEKDAIQKHFDMEAKNLLANIEMIKENIQNVYTFRNVKAHESILSVTDHFVTLTSELVSKAKSLFERPLESEIFLLELLLWDWSAKAHYIVAESQSLKGMDKTTLKYIKERLQNKDLSLQPYPQSETLNITPDIKLEETPVAVKGPKHTENPFNSVTNWTMAKNDLSLANTTEFEKMFSILEAPSENMPNTNSVAALSLTEDTDDWEDDENKIVQVTKQMANQVCYMAQFLRNQGPIQTKEQLIASARQIASSGKTFATFAGIIAKYCIDRRCATELLCAVQQIPTISNQLTIISSVKASTPCDRSADEVLVKNAQNLMQTILHTIQAAEAACIKGLRQPPPNTDEAEAVTLCIQWKKKLLKHRAQEATNPETDELGLRKISAGKIVPTLASIFKVPDSL
ncbi:uncharacterized protein LOC122792394 [Protopterus annectens]|uniref:uncharacterized protein LOC122792394 n=1 Tax=Protopterus annectens TaxID=7888 RepID=UPI001CFA6905|nr:uncharacterized protein LOC122792394 [Protopterus annectens]